MQTAALSNWIDLLTNLIRRTSTKRPDDIVHALRIRKNITKSLAIASAVVLMIIVCGVQSRSLRMQRHRKLMQQTAGYTAGMPPMLTFATVALGGFRGVIADMLWLRVSRLQEQRRFVELVQLSDWVTKLEPYMPEVWIFHAWNMAYNVSVLLPRPEDKWRWVKNGIELLRNEGIVLNPRSAKIHRELGWIFQHKLGMNGDRASGYFRITWAREMNTYLGKGGSLPDHEHVSVSNLEAATGMNVEVMQTIEAAFGQVDWRVPMAHSLYWGWKGLQFAEDSERLPCRRMVYVSLVEMARRSGRIVGDLTAEGEDLRLQPNTALIDSAVAFIEKTMAEHAFSGVRFAYIGLLREGMHIRMAEGREADARKLYEKMAAFFKNKTDRPFPVFEQTLTVEDDFFESLLAAAGYF